MRQAENRAYAQTERGKAARARSQVRQTAKRRAQNAKPPTPNTTAVAALLATWGR